MRRLLVADPDLLDAMEQQRWFLHPSRYTVARARTAAAAIAQARQARPDLLVAAFTRDEGAGVSLVQQVRAIPGCSELRVLFTVDQALAQSQRFRVKAAAAGVEGLLVRPITREEFLGAVRRVMLPAGGPTVRVPVSVPATVATAVGSIQGQVVNLSQGGLCLAVPRPLTPGARVQVGLTLPRFTSPLTLPGLVRWATAPAADEAARESGGGRLAHGVGVAFAGLPHLAQSTLNLFILSSPRAVQL